MRRFIFAAAAVAITAPLASAQIFLPGKDNYGSLSGFRDERSAEVTIPDPITSEAQLVQVRDDILDVASDLCKDKWRSSAIDFRAQDACTASAFQSAVDGLPDGEVKAYLDEYFVAELERHLR